MKNQFEFSFSKELVVALSVLIGLNVVGTFSEDAMVLQSTSYLFIPLFLGVFFIKNKSINVLFALFLLHSFIGDSASLFFSNDTVIKASSVMCFSGYLCLIGFMVPKLKMVGFSKVITLYLILVVFISMYFLYIIYGVLKAVIPDSLEVLLFGMKSVSLVILVIIAFGAYLNSETKMSILFLMMAISFVFSDALNYVSQYYVYHWSFLMLDRILHAAGVFFLLNYIIEYNKNPKLMYTKEQMAIKNILV